MSCHVDDVVEIGIPEALMVKGALLVYLLPIVLMLLGAALASNNAALLALIPEDPAAMLGALTGFVSGLLISKFNSLRHRQDPSLNPRLLKCEGHRVNTIIPSSPLA